MIVKKITKEKYEVNKDNRNYTVQKLSVSEWDILDSDGETLFLANSLSHAKRVIESGSIIEYRYDQEK